MRLSLAAVNSSPGAASALRAPSRALAMATSSALSTPMPASSIASGPPDSMTIYVQEVSFRSGKSSLKVFQSASAKGTAITLTNTTIDLAGALGLASLSVPAGSYDGIDVTVSRVANVKGCVTGLFASTNPVSGPLSAATLAAAPLHQGNLYSNDPITDGASHTFCTQSARSEVATYTYSTNPIGSNAQFEASASPEVTQIDLARGNPEGFTPAQISAASVTVSTLRSFDVTAGGETRLLLAVDLDRMLRYFANTREDLQPPNPTMKAGTSYFFTSVFLDSAMLAPADGTTIEGYRLVVTVSGSGQSAVLEEWMTVIRGPDGAPLGGVIIPDDDNTLTVAKGSIDPATSTLATTGSWNLVFDIGSLAGEIANLGRGGHARTPAEWALYIVGLIATAAVTVYITRIARAALGKKV